MELSLWENIGRLRREKGMTQERLAEALGVSFAAVSKWERCAATPELRQIARMADLFGVSVDALIGYRPGDNSRDALVDRLKKSLHAGGSQQALDDAEDALRRYPNCFEVVYYSAANYRVMGMRSGSAVFLEKALALFRHACRLMDQNTDPALSETSLHRDMANLLIALDKPRQGVELLCAHNPCQLNHPLIGQTLASACGDPEGALPYLSAALLDLSVSQMQIAIGYINVYIKAGDFQNALSLLDWALAFYPGLRKGEESGCLDKVESALWTIRAHVLLQLGQARDAEGSLRQAAAIARRFDAAPRYEATSLRFVAEDTAASVIDDLGQTAMDGVGKTVSDLADDALSALWGPSGMKDRRSSYRARFYDGNRLCFSLAALSSILTAALNLLIAWVLQQMIDTVSGVPGSLGLPVLALLITGVLALVAAVKSLQYVSKPRFLQKAMTQYKNFAFARLTQKSAAVFRGEDTSGYLSAFSHDTASVETGYLETQFDLIANAVTFVGALLMMLSYSPAMTVISCVFFLLPIGASLLTGGRLEKAEREVSDRNGAFTAALKDCLSGFSVMKSFQAEDAIFFLFSRRNQEAEQAKRQKRQLVILIGALAGMAGVIAQLGTFWAGAWLALTDWGITPGVLIIFIDLTANMIGPMQ